MSNHLKQIWLDLRPQSLINRSAFDEFYQLLDEYKEELRKLHIIPTDFAFALIYTSFSLINQCKYSSSSTDLMNEWDKYNKTIFRVFNSDQIDELDELETEWITKLSLQDDNEIQATDLVKIMKYLNELVKKNGINKYDLIRSVIYGLIK